MKRTAASVGSCLVAVLLSGVGWIVFGLDTVAQWTTSVEITITRPATSTDSEGVPCTFGIGTPSNGTGVIQRVFVTNQNGTRAPRTSQLIVKDTNKTIVVAADVIGIVASINSQEVCVFKANVGLGAVPFYTVFVDTQEVATINMDSPPKELDLYTI